MRLYVLQRDKPHSTKENIYRQKKKHRPRTASITYLRQWRISGGGDGAISSPPPPRDSTFIFIYYLNIFVITHVLMDTQRVHLIIVK